MSDNIVKLSFQLAIVISVIILADNLTYSTTFDVFAKQNRMFAFRTILILNEFFTGRKFTPCLISLLKLSFQLVIVISVIILADNLTNSMTFDVFAKQNRMYAFRTMLILDEFFTGRKFTSMSNILVRLNFQLVNAIF